MAYTAPPILPVTAAAGSGATTGSTAAPAISTLRLFFSRISDTARRSLAHRRPWWKLLDRSAFARPDSLSDAASRLRKNLGYFRVNYLALLAAALALSLLSHPCSSFSPSLPPGPSSTSFAPLTPLLSSFSAAISLTGRYSPASSSSLYSLSS